MSGSADQIAQARDPLSSFGQIPQRILAGDRMRPDAVLDDDHAACDWATRTQGAQRQEDG